ncbi:hypothetical protein [Planctomyces sp. SH-PL62]|uniref:hypothetical protein n=1 Tax=Planctomyces sp. SH-PL62 TaxID=1636152 RepID=UPI00078D0F40|nr:hypothetical protein [Planctomyces sp. SH-PL62]AMV35965.1 hypothetical protein VT85_00875 [Planctomyces sp. SH-PL62]
MGLVVLLWLLVSGCSPRSSSPEPAPEPAPTGVAVSSVEAARQVTVFAIKAEPGESAIDPRLTSVRVQLRKVLPDHGFELIVSRSERLSPGETLACDLGGGRVAETTLESDDAGRVTLRCSFQEGDAPPFVTVVDAPENQLFFYERSLRDGSRVLIGVGAR